jgi:hypothetical protein
MKPEQYGVRRRNGNFNITVGRRGSSNMGRRLRGGREIKMLLQHYGRWSDILLV